VNSVFADSSFYQALFNQRDSLHGAAVQLFKGVHGKVVTTEYVLFELGALMSCGNARALFSRFSERVQRDPFTELIPASPALFQSGLRLFSNRPDKAWSLTDCTSFVLMEQQGITDALTSDHHFGQAGFKVLLQR